MVTLILVCVVFLLAMQVLLQFVWTQRLHRQHGNGYSFWFIYRKLGRSLYGRMALQLREPLEPAFRKDLEHVQSNLFLCFIVVGMIVFAIVAWHLLSIT